MLIRDIRHQCMLLLVTFALIHVASGRFCYTDCFRTKGCDFKPYGCTPYVNCTYAYSYQSDGTWAYFEILGQASSTVNHYVALAFGSSPAMGNNTVLECSSFNGGPLLGRVSYNQGRSNMRVQMTESQQNELVRTLAIDYYNGMIYCHIARRIDVPPSVDSNTVFPLGPPTYPIMASGQTTTDASGQGALQVHSLDQASPAYPFVSSQTISVYQFSIPPGSIIPVTQGSGSSGQQNVVSPQYAPQPPQQDQQQQPISPLTASGPPVIIIGNTYNNENGGPPPSPPYAATQASMTSSDEPPQNVTVYVNPLIVYTQPGGPGSGEIIYATQSSLPNGGIQNGFVAAGPGHTGGGPVIIAGAPGTGGTGGFNGGYTGPQGVSGQGATVNGQPIYGPEEVVPNENSNRPNYEGYGPGEGQQGVAGGNGMNPGYSPVTQMPPSNQGGPSSQGYNANDAGQTPMPLNNQATTPFPQNGQNPSGAPINGVQNSTPYPQGGQGAFVPGSYNGPTNAPFVPSEAGQGSTGVPMQSNQNFQGTPQPGNRPLNDQQPYGASTVGYNNGNTPSTQGYGPSTSSGGSDVYPAGIIPVGAGMGGGSTTGPYGATTMNPNSGFSGPTTMNPQEQQMYPGSNAPNNQGHLTGQEGPGVTATTPGSNGQFGTSSPSYGNQGSTQNPQFDQNPSTQNGGGAFVGPAGALTSTPAFGSTQGQGQGQGQGFQGTTTPGYGYQTTTDINGHSFPAASTSGYPSTNGFNNQQSSAAPGFGGIIGQSTGSSTQYPGPTTNNGYPASTSQNTPFPGYGQTQQSSTYPTTPINQPFYGSTNVSPQGMAQGSTQGYANQNAYGPGSNNQGANGNNNAANIPFRDEYGVHGIIPGSNISIEPSLLKVHAILMTLSWMIFFSTSILFARFYRGFWPNSTLCGLFMWFHLHRTLNIIGIGASIAGFVCIFVARDWQWVGPRPDMSGVHNRSWPAVHAMCGLLACVIVWFQPINAVMRCHPKGIFRPLYNIFHAVFGYGGFILGIAAIMIACTHFDFMFIKQRGAFGLCIAFMGATALVFVFLELLSICQWFKQRRNTGDIEIVQPDGRTHVTLCTATKRMNCCRLFVFLLYLVPAIGCAVAISALIGTRKNDVLHQGEMNYLLSPASNSKL